jgi:hypothetical protein
VAKVLGQAGFQDLRERSIVSRVRHVIIIEALRARSVCRLAQAPQQALNLACTAGQGLAINC